MMIGDKKPKSHQPIMDPPNELTQDNINKGAHPHHVSLPGTLEFYIFIFKMKLQHICKHVSPRVVVSYAVFLRSASLNTCVVLPVPVHLFVSTTHPHHSRCCCYHHRVPVVDWFYTGRGARGMLLSPMHVCTCTHVCTLPVHFLAGFRQQEISSGFLRQVFQSFRPH